jgi:hypothetical protein
MPGRRVINGESIPENAFKTEKMFHAFFYIWVIASSAVVTMSLFLIMKSRMFTDSQFQANKFKIFSHLVLLCVYLIFGLPNCFFPLYVPSNCIYLAMRFLVDSGVAYIVFVLAKKPKETLDRIISEHSPNTLKLSIHAKSEPKERSENAGSFISESDNENQNDQTGFFDDEDKPNFDQFLDVV